MAMHQESSRVSSFVYWGRLAVVFFAILAAATHFGFAGSSGSPPTHTGNFTTSNGIGGTGGYTGAPPSGNLLLGFQALTLWVDIEIVCYTLMAVVFLFGMRSWYPVAVIFNAFNLAIYLLSGLMPIPGITSSAFASHFGLFSSSLTNWLLGAAWVMILILGILLIKYDPGSALDHLIHPRDTRR